MKIPVPHLKPLFLTVSFSFYLSSSLLTSLYIVDYETIICRTASFVNTLFVDVATFFYCKFICCVI
nr:MAG TPA: hypothetical protein [Caudoviricetes sp.]